MFSGFDDDGFPVAQHDAHGDAARVSPYELHHTFGFASRPRDPDLGSDGQPIAGKSCAQLVMHDGDETHAFLCADPRFTAGVPQLKKGGSVRYCAPGSFELFDGADGTNTLYVSIPGQSKAHVVTTGLDGNGDPYIGIQHADGMAVTMLNGSLVIRNNAGDSYLEVNAAGIIQNGNTRMNGGLVVGTGATPAALAIPLVSYLTALETTLAGLATAIDAKLAPSPGVSTGAVTAFVAAASAFKTAIVATFTSIS